MQGRNNEVGIESGLDDMGWESEAGAESSIDIYTLLNVKYLAGGKQQHSTGRMT